MTTPGPDFTNAPSNSHGAVLDGLPHEEIAPRAAELLERVLFEVKRIVVGQDRMIERMLVCLIARGHCLLEGVPGLAKTLAVETLSRTVRGSFVRIQFTPDLVPSDIVGTQIFSNTRETFEVALGPVFANFVVADEINRAPAKVQSALLEVMSERQVSIGGVTHTAPDPFLVLATQNPIESEGVYPLPEAQRDRFLMKILVPYPTTTEELEIVNRMGVDPPTARPVLETSDLLFLQHAADRVFVHHAIVEYAVRLVFATRDPEAFGLEGLARYIAYGASPRATLGLVAAGRALALLRGRDYVLPSDLTDVASDVLRHRIVLSFEALAEGYGVETIVDRAIEFTAPPQVTPSQDRDPMPVATAVQPPDEGPRT
jgi:MoxR-like ATPase